MPQPFFGQSRPWDRAITRLSRALLSALVTAEVSRMDAAAQEVSGSVEGEAKLSRKRYEKKLRKLQIELCYLQDWVRETGARVVILFEGRDTAGKGGLIRVMTERVSPRTFRVAALSAPVEGEKK